MHGAYEIREKCAELRGVLHSTTCGSRGLGTAICVIPLSSRKRCQNAVGVEVAPVRFHALGRSRRVLSESPASGRRTERKAADSKRPARCLLESWRGGNGSPGQ